MSNVDVIEETSNERDSVYGEEAVRLMLLQPLNMFEPLDIQVLHKTIRHEDERAE